MSSISGLGGNTLSGTSSLRGYGGLASGLDRDTLIKNMTYATSSKIAAQKQKKQTIAWTQEAMRNITGKTYEFSSKYMSYASSSNLLGSKLFSRNQVTALGSNSGFVSVTGSSVSADTISILGVKSLAQIAQMTTNQAVSDQTLMTGGVSNDLSTETWADQVTGESLTIKYGSKSYTVTLVPDKDFKYDATGSDADVQAAANQATTDLLNRSLSKVSIGDGKTLADVMKAEYDSVNNRMTFTNTETAGNTLKITGASGDLMVDLGFIGADEDVHNLPANRLEIDKANGLTGTHDVQAVKKETLAEQLSGKKISFSYNGKVKWITLDKYYDSETSAPIGGKDLEDVKKDMQKKLDEAFGKGRVNVDFANQQFDPSDSSKLLSASFQFKATLPDGGTDNSSVLAITAAERGLLGHNSLFGIEDGASNRLNLSTGIGASGLIRNPADLGIGVNPDPDHIDDMDNTTNPPQPKNHMVISNDGVSVDLTEKYGLNWESSISDIINRVNNEEDLGIKITYQNNADKFVVQSTEQGASGKVALGGNLSKVLFGKEPTADGTGGDYTVQEGKDAVITVKYAGSGEVMDITRGSNTISVDGLNVTVKDTFGYDDAGNYIEGTEAITFDAKVDSENTTKVVHDMVDAFNEVLNLINSEVNQKPDRNYAPLTDEQREGMSESQIEKWEKEAKKGLLFNDTDVRGYADALRFSIPPSMRAQFDEMGITVSTDYADNGKLVFNETKFKAALEKDPDAVYRAFTAEEEKDKDGTIVQEAGLMTKMKTVMDRYSSMTGVPKGILVERAGSVYAPTTVLQNSMQKQMDDIDDNIDSLGDKLKTEQDRYISQFTRLETMISQMNSQSSYLTSMFSS